MPLFKPDTAQRRHTRHSIDLSHKSRHDKSISTAFKVWLGAYALAMAIGLTVASAHAAPSQTAPIAQSITEPMQTISPLLVTPNAMQSGGLLFKAKEAGKFIEAPKVATDIKLDVTGPVARAIVTQKFLNPSDSWLEGIYVFPLPDNAAVDQLKMKIGDRLIEGLIKPKQEARALYEAAKRDGKKASLLEQQRPNLFTNAVANIGPNESITIQIEYQQTVPRKDDRFSLRVPLVVAPRYNPMAKPLQPS
ncbi:VIT domain-containing protein [Cohaesibacter celericrescens]|uniref:VIT domain-containing protein n=1 Tax=Cohaesibacter celericrescens TaxID=2067669 RepID=UPI001FE18F9E|nr:VIT domain-containing protein [Cohaesibacter celericrescens]